jgi:hypothetical protein
VTETQQGTLALLAKLNSPLSRGYLLKQLRARYLPESRPHASALLDAWLHAAASSKLTPLRQARPGPSASTTTVPGPSASTTTES